MNRLSLVLLWVLFTAVVSFGQTPLYLPQLANGVQSDGVYWKTTFLITNTASPSSTGYGYVTFYYLASNGGGFHPWPSDDPDCCLSATWTLAGGQTLKVVSDGTGPLTVGYTRVVRSETIAVTAVFSKYSSSGALISEASIPIADQLSKQAIFVDSQNGFSTGVALVNPNAESATITLELVDAQGQSVGAPLQRSLAARNQVAAFVSELFPEARNLVGTMRITSSAPIGVSALSFSPNGVFTTVPTVVLTDQN
jgi:hypothetical protein